MKNLFFITFIALLGLGISSCKNNEDNNGTGKPGEVKITADVTGNTAKFHAEAENAVSYIWDLGNGQTPSEQDVEGTFPLKGSYTVKCTAKGRDEDNQASTEITIENDDETIFNAASILMSGFDRTTGESTATWVWASGDGNMAAGPMDYGYDTCYVNAFDESWWQSNEAAGEGADSSVYDDEYQFKLNSSMEYVNNFGSAFMINWMYAAKNFGLSTEVWGDVAYDAYEAPEASWSVEFIPNINDSLKVTTKIGNETFDGAWVIHLTNNAYFGYGAYGHDYQICKYENDTLLIRYDNRVPDDIANYFDQADLDDNGVTGGEQEWDYFRLVKKQ